MKLRTRLVIAFLLLSVLPLAAVTGYSYYSSQRAFRRAVQAESTLLAAELGQRMEIVAADLERRVARIWDMPTRAARGDAAPTPSAEPAAAAGDVLTGEVAVALGDAASFLDRIEIVRSARADTAVRTGPPEAADRTARVARGRGPVAAGAPEPPLPPAPPLPPQPIVIDLKSIVAEATKDDPDAQKAVQAGLRLVEGILGSALDLGLKGTATGLRLGAAELARIAEERARALETRRHTLEKLKGGVLDMPITRDGEVVGQINARLNLAQVFHSVLSMTRSDQGEIPFAIDGQRRIYTLQPGDRARLETLGLRSGGTAVERDDWIVVRSHDPSGMVFGIARPIGAGLADIRRTAVRNLGLGLSFILIALVGIVPLSSGMTRNLKTLTDGVHRLAGGDLRTRVLVRSRDEFGLLAQAFNQMTEDLQRHQKAAVEQERLRSELQLCRQIQTEMLPHERLRLGLTEVKGVSIPAREVGGDFFNYFAVGEDQVALLVGDVSGKGVGAALLMANIQATLRARLPLERDLKQLVDAIDRDVERNTPRGVFITLFVGILDLQAKTMRYVNAGHHPQFVLRREGGLDRLPGTGLPVGLFAGHGYEEQAVTLADGDLLFFYTDGMVEAESDTGDMFSTERLEALLLRAHNDGIDDLLARIESEVQQFRGGAEPFDDATMMALRVA